MMHERRHPAILPLRTRTKAHKLPLEENTERLTSPFHVSRRSCDWVYQRGNWFRPVSFAFWLMDAVSQNPHSCEEFAQQGCKVYATARKLESIGEFRGKTIEKLALDVNSDEGVNNVVQHIANTEGKIDLVVNNAGFFVPGALRRPLTRSCSSHLKRLK